MSRFNRLHVYQQMGQSGIVPLFFNNDLRICTEIMNACYLGGARILEFTNRGDFAHELFAALNKYAVDHWPDLILGAGSVLDGPTAALYIQSGAAFIVAPVLHEDTAIICNRRKIAWMPGCGSVTEISRAEELGAEVVKIFPATQVGGFDFIKAVKGPMPWTHIMPTGGVKPEEENIKKWFEAGAFCLGMGSQLMVKGKDGKFDYAEIEKLMKLSLEYATQYRK
jgi:2-dehydro-3-deoxyphosphogluconate aldolase/(4S)-4-hydroxy-2-oxoglutarate aldolase